MISIIFNVLQYISAGASGDDMAEYHDHVILSDLLTTRERLLKEYDMRLENRVNDFKERLFSPDHERDQFSDWIFEISREMEKLRCEIIGRIQPMEVASGVKSRYPEYLGIEEDTAVFAAMKIRCID